MSDTNQMLRAIINGQSDLKQELLKKIDGVEERLGGRIDGVEEKIEEVEKNLTKKIKENTKRLDKIGSQLAYLEDDTPSREEHDLLAERVENIETRFI